MDGLFIGWGGWIRTNEMAESESAALPLGYTPKSKDGTYRPVPPSVKTNYEDFLVKPANFLLNLDNCPPVSIKRYTPVHAG